MVAAMGLKLPIKSTVGALAAAASWILNSVRETLRLTPAATSTPTVVLMRVRIPLVPPYTLPHFLVLSPNKVGVGT